MSRQKHVPLRSCVGCRTKRPKRELTRIVRTPQGTVAVDMTGRSNGRGAYLCSRPACWVDGVKRGRLAHALNASLEERDQERLLTHAPGRENYQSPALASVRA